MQSVLNPKFEKKLLQRRDLDGSHSIIQRLRIPCCAEACTKGRARFHQDYELSSRLMLALLCAGPCLGGMAYRLERNGYARCGRGRPQIEVHRQLAAYFANVTLGVSFVRIGAGLGCDRTTIAASCNRIEDARDDKLTDQLIEIYERAVEVWVTTFHVHLSEQEDGETENE